LQTLSAVSPQAPPKRTSDRSLMRVIAGAAKGRTLAAPKGLAIRPTTDKVKGAVFSMLDAAAFRRADGAYSPTFPFSRVLDLYSGTGALGIEALSRGAGHCDFVESNPKARALIVENLRRTGFTSKATVHGIIAELAVSTFYVAYDLILADPPYSDPAVLALIDALGESQIVGEGSLVVVEHARSMEVPSRAGRLHLARSRYHGTSAIALYEAAPSLDRLAS